MPGTVSEIQEQPIEHIEDNKQAHDSEHSESHESEDYEDFLGGVSHPRTNVNTVGSLFISGIYFARSRNGNRSDKI